MASPNQPPAGNQVTTGAQNVEGTIQDILAYLRDRIAGMNWLQLFALLKQIIALFTGQQPTPQGAKVAPPRVDAAKYQGCGFGDCCKSHFELIETVAECGAACCENHPEAK